MTSCRKVCVSLGRDRRRRVAHLVDACLVKHVPPGLKPNAPLEHKFPSDRLEHEVDDDLGVLVEPLPDACEQTLGLEDLRLEADVAGREERENEKDEEGADVGLVKHVGRGEGAQARLEEAGRHLRAGGKALRRSDESGDGSSGGEGAPWVTS